MILKKGSLLYYYESNKLRTNEKKAQLPNTSLAIVAVRAPQTHL
jgi:hypothetical protein